MSKGPFYEALDREIAQLLREDALIRQWFRTNDPEIATDHRMLLEAGYVVIDVPWAKTL